MLRNENNAQIMQIHKMTDKITEGTGTIWWESVANEETAAVSSYVNICFPHQSQEMTDKIPFITRELNKISENNLPI